MSQHTPGPWTVGEDEGTSKAHEIIHKGHVVAWTCSHDPYEEGNARLIAKAPEMLEILRQLAVLYLPWGNLQDDICALLQEIEGESDGLP